MAFDHERYRLSVIEPARKHNNAVPPNLFARYALSPGSISDDAQFHDHLREVERYWRRLLNRQIYKALATALLIAHAQLGRLGVLNGISSFQECHNHQVRDGQQRLKQWADGVKDSATCVARERVESWVVSLGGPLSVTDAKKALHDRGVKVEEPHVLPSAPPPKFGDLRKHLKSLGLLFSVEVVDKAELANGFSVLNGFRFTRPAAPVLGRGAIEAAKRQYTGRRDERSTAANNVLNILLAKCERAGELDALLLWETVEALRLSMESGLSQRMLAEAAVALGLVRDEADILSMSLFEARGTSSAPGAVREIEKLLGAGQLRAAERLAASLSQTGDERVKEVAERVEALGKRVSALATEAERARSAGRTEDAAERLAEALQIVIDDPDLRARLAAIPPPAPTDLRATVDDGVVTLSWRPSPARTGKLRYRVVRRIGQAAVSAGQGKVVGETEQLEVSDREPATQDTLFGQSLRYSVFAARPEGVWSSAARAGPVVIAPDVTDLRVSSDATSVNGSWRVSPRAADVIVVRREHQPPATPTDGHRVPAPTRGSFADTDVRTGTRYFYRVSAVYLTPGGQREVAPGVVVSAVPESAPTPVTDLAAGLLAGGGGEASWTAPRSGAVSIHVTDRPPPWAAGTVISLADLAAFGRPVEGTPAQLPDGRASLPLPSLAGRCSVTAMTVGSAHALVGNTAQLMVVAAVSGLQAQRLDESVRLSWVWSPESTAALVRWRSQATDTRAWREAVCSRRDYRDAGGFTIAIGPEPHTVAVHAMVSGAGDDALAAPIMVAVPGLRARVRYSIRYSTRREGLRRRSRATVELRAERRCESPPLLVVHREGGVMPLDAWQGEQIGRIPSQDLRPETPYTQTFDIPAARGPSWVRCFPDGDAGDVVLVDPPTSELKVG